MHPRVSANRQFVGDSIVTTTTHDDEADDDDDEVDLDDVLAEMCVYRVYARLFCLRRSLAIGAGSRAVRSPSLLK